MKIFLFFIAAFIPISVFAESVTIEQAIKRIVKNNIHVLKMKYEYQRSDSDEKKSKSKYSYKAIAEASIKESKLPFNRANFFSGTKSQTNRYAAGIETMFESGTYFRVEASSTRFDSNAFEGDMYASSGFQSLGIPPLYTGQIKALISQDLLKNSFGYAERKQNEILQNKSEMTKNEISARISGLIVESLISFWNYTIAKESLHSYERLHENTKRIRNLYVRKQQIGLAESFEINNWNALLTQAESRMEEARLNLTKAELALKRDLNLAANEDIPDVELLQELNFQPDPQKDLDYAYKHRADYLNILKLKNIAALRVKIAQNAALPEAKLSASVSSQGQTIVSPGENFSDSNHGVTSGKYKEYGAQLSIKYPLFDPGVKADKKDAEIFSRQILLDEERVRREVHDDVNQQIETLLVSQKIYKNTILAEAETRKYYNGIYSKFSRGKYDALTIKNSLDSLIQSELRTIQTKINFNINLMRYHISKNSINENFGINPNEFNS